MATKTKAHHTLAQKLANPEWRASLPDSKLSRSQLVSRKAAQKRKLDNQTLYNPAAQLTGDNLRHAISSMVDAQVVPQKSLLDQQERSATGQFNQASGRAVDYFKQYADRLSGDVTEQQGITDRNNAAHAGITGQSAEALRAAQQQMAVRATEDASVRGDLANIGQAGAVQAAAQMQADQAGRNAAASGGAADRNTASERAATGTSKAQGLKGGEVLGELAARFAGEVGKVNQGRRDLADKAAGLRSEVTTKLRQEQFNNLIAIKGVNLKRKDLEQAGLIASGNLTEKQKHNQAMEGAANTRAGNSAARLSFDMKKDDYQRSRHLGPYAPKKAAGESSHSLTMRGAIATIAEDYRGLAYDGSGKKVRPLGRVVEILSNRAKKAGQSLPRMLLVAGADIANFGHILPKHQSALDAAGITVPPQWQK